MVARKGDSRSYMNVMALLDDAHRLGRLRAVGPVHQFHHAELQNHLAHRHPRVDPLL
ncbi:hypothetical protein ABZS66_35690 [Dactylosporangium sp. NPDC005572]|uniref:hypothetical protein n=1 Tax=Dactylosporangium sp. NPDC005572 TaxID=3156889 RepID=UPI0033BEB3C6